MNKKLKRPISESYWVEPGKFLAGEYPGKFNAEETRQRVDALLEAGFTTFIDLTKPNETVPYISTLLEQARYYKIDVQHHSYPIWDFGLPTPEKMHKILNKIDQALQANQKIYLHCWGGIGRTGTTVGCYLVRRGKTGEEALNQLATWWSSVPKSQIHVHSPETRAQADFILNWHEFDGGQDR
ncbi:MAG TPA: dual specificity protein phosphatase family protein [Anaerolineales bacterium]|nr:dual specificity protein phosphatase family protein [Anaerolineales bacterium]